MSRQLNQLQSEGTFFNDNLQSETYSNQKSKQSNSIGKSRVFKKLTPKETFDFSVKSEIDKFRSKDKLIPFNFKDNINKRRTKSKSTIGSYLDIKHKQTREKLKLLEKLDKEKENSNCTFRPSLNENTKRILSDCINYDNISIHDRLNQLKTHAYENRYSKRDNTNYNATSSPNILKQSRDLPRTINDLYCWKDKINNKILDIKNSQEKTYSTKISLMNPKSKTILEKKKQESKNELKEDESKAKVKEESEDKECKKQIKEKENKPKEESKNNLKMIQILNIRANLNHFYKQKQLDKENEEYKQYMTKKETFNNQVSSLREKIEKNIEEKLNNLLIQNTQSSYKPSYTETNFNYNLTSTIPSYSNNSFKHLVEERQRLSEENLINEQNHKSCLSEKTYSVLREYNKKEPDNQNDFYYTNKYNDRSLLNNEQNNLYSEDYFKSKRKIYESEFEKLNQKNSNLDIQLESNNISERGLITKLS